MSNLSSIVNKHKLEGIGEAQAVLLFASLSANPSTAFLTLGVPGKLLFKLSTIMFTRLASLGLVFMNIGVERLLNKADKVKFDGTLESAIRLVEEIQKTGRDLTPKEIETIDNSVKESFRKFAKLMRKKK